MTSTRNIDIMYEGSSIRIGKNRKTNRIYFQRVEDSQYDFWYRFEPEYYQDYANFMNDYTDYLDKQSIYPDMSHRIDIDT